ncbi:MAG: tRNA 4-thiouridine(8) synthase ThiI [Treponema sp.]|nr:tRNA 4-thiouridine(8) synthase ThiI [Treponema sp.]
MKTYIGMLGELTLKGSNIKLFEKQLVRNLRHSLSGFDVRIELKTGRLYVRCDEKASSAVEFALSHLIGITAWAEVRTTEKTFDAIKKAVREEGLKAREKGASTFKIEARREDKDFPLTSYEIAVQAAGVLFDDGTLKVDVHKPDCVIRVEVRDKVYVYCSQNKAPRGLPVGVSGKGLLLLSGGLDSPVAGWRMMRRGMKVDCIYFHSYPYTSKEAQEKVETLAEKLSYYGVETYLNIIPFTDVQMQIKKKAPEPFTTLMLRLCMAKCASRLAEYINADCLITGESLGQVASQTNENMRCTEHFASLPLYRPLIGMDKEEIVTDAVTIGTYETSILPYEDCCVLFSPRHPVLRASLDEACSVFDSLEIEELIQKAFDERVIKHFSIKEKLSAE